MKIVLLLCAFCTFVWPQLSEAANILVLEGVPSPSHHIWYKININVFFICYFIVIMY